MAEQRGAATTSMIARVTSAVHDEAREAALARWDAPPDVFVWRARRCAEAVLYALLARQSADVKALAQGRKGLDQLLEHKQLDGALSREMRTQLTSLRDFGNLAAHYQLESGVSRDSAEAVARLLAGLLREFYTMGGGTVPDADRPILAALGNVNHRLRAPMEVERDTARRRVEELTRQLSATATAPPNAPARSVPLGVSAGLALAGLLVGGAVGHSARSGVGAPIDTDAHAVVTSALPLATPSVAAPIAATPAATPVARVVATPSQPPPSAVARSCPDGMQWLQSDDAATGVCFDADAVTLGEYRRCVVAGRCLRTQPGLGCNWENGASAKDNGANCLTHSDARAFCGWRLGAGGDLPTRAEWALASASRGRVLLLPGTREWTADLATPEAAFARGASDPQFAGRYAWSSERTTTGRRDLSFRCVRR